MAKISKKKNMKSGGGVISISVSKANQMKEKEKPAEKGGIGENDNGGVIGVMA